MVGLNLEVYKNFARFVYLIIDFGLFKAIKASFSQIQRISKGLWALKKSQEIYRSLKTLKKIWMFKRQYEEL